MRVALAWILPLVVVALPGCALQPAPPAPELVSVQAWGGHTAAGAQGTAPTQQRISHITRHHQGET